MYCIKCGMQLPDDARFCSGCGTKTGTPVEQPAVENEPGGYARTQPVGFSAKISDPAFDKYRKDSPPKAGLIFFP